MRGPETPSIGLACGQSHSSGCRIYVTFIFGFRARNLARERPAANAEYGLIAAVVDTAVTWRPQTLNAMDSTTLTDAAFGADPGRWPLPPARSTGDLWLRAVAAGGQGRYGAARADLDELLRRQPAGRLASLAASTRASFLRQTGWHDLARGWDGRAAALSGDDAECGLDALIGLAADALGVGRFQASAALLERAQARYAQADGLPARLAIRMEWVRAELAMATGDGDTALGHARRGVALAESALPGLRRHRVKSDVVLAAALCSAGDQDGAREVGALALAATAEYRLIPLHWAVACLLAEIGHPGASSLQTAAARDRSAAFVTRHGGRWKPS